MKSIRTSKIARIIGAAMALALILGFAGSLQAQYKATGNDGITASPKLRQFLDEQKNVPPSSIPAEASKMGCPTCKDKVTTRIDTSARGAIKPVVRVVTHLCKTCDTQLKTIGVGKATRTLATHSCGGCEVATMD